MQGCLLRLTLVVFQVVTCEKCRRINDVVSSIDINHWKVNGNALSSENFSSTDISFSSRLIFINTRTFTCLLFDTKEERQRA